ncbi:MAG: hypothetical protein JJ863_09145 [Deltaproteobacteria bacterium]|nr:hypothetical protein [Deltaproteobacteria bacterium]
MLLLLPQSAFAQAPDVEPEPEVSDEPEPEVSDEPEPEVSDEPEPEVSDEGEDEEGETEGPGEITGPEVVHPPESAAGATGAVTTPAPTTQAAAAGAPVEDAAEDMQEEEAAAGGGAAGAGGGEDGEGGPGEQDTADRLAQANPNSGLPWALPINFSQTFTVGLYADQYDLTKNPTYGWSLSAIPRYNFSNGLSLGLRIPLSIEWTEADFTTGNRYLWWGDLQFDATYTLPWKPGGTLIIPSALVSVGTSPISRGAERYVGPGGRLLLIKPIPVLGGLILGGGMSYTYWAGGQNGAVSTRGAVRGGTDALPCELAISPGTSSGTGFQSNSSSDCNVVPGTATPIRHVVSAGIFGTLIPAAGWQINLSYTAIWNKGDGVGTDCVQTLSGLVCLGDESPTHWRQLTSFSFSFGYDVTSYMTVTAGYSTLAFHPDSEGTRAENMFFNENTQVNLAVQFRVDGFVVELNKEEAAEGGDESAAADGLRRSAF